MTVYGQGVIVLVIVLVIVIVLLLLDMVVTRPVLVCTCLSQRRNVILKQGNEILHEKHRRILFTTTVFIIIM